MNMANMPPSITSTLAHCGLCTCALEFPDTVEGKGSTRAQIDGHQSSKLRYLYSLRRSMQTWLGSLELAFGTKSGYSQV